MNWLKTKLRNWILESELDDFGNMTQTAVSNKKHRGIGRDEESKLSSEGIKLQIYKASGGFVVETRKFDERNDRHLYTMHVITEEQDLGDALGKIVIMEALR